MTVAPVTPDVMHAGMNVICIHIKEEVREDLSVQAEAAIVDSTSVKLRLAALQLRNLSRAMRPPEPGGSLFCIIATESSQF